MPSIPMNDQCSDIVARENEDVLRSSSQSSAEVKIGQWFWVIANSDQTNGSDSSGGHDDLMAEDPASFSLVGERNQPAVVEDPENPAGDAADRWLGCVIHIGSNYYLIQSPRIANTSRSVRIHHKDYWSRMVPEPRAEDIIKARGLRAQAMASEAMAQIQEISAALSLSSSARPATHSGGVLMVLSSTNNLDSYKGFLSEAKDKLLPELFDRVKEANAMACGWMMASTLPMVAQADGLKGMVSSINDRLLAVSLYAGFEESIYKIQDGSPAAMGEKLHVFQQRLYMDEESLIDYEVGGMDFQNIHDFDRWLTKPGNLATILPYPRCMVAMRVRREKKDRGYLGTPESLFINIRQAISDKYTYLYVRNGQQVFRICTEIDFGEKIFPDKSEFDPSEPLLFKTFGSSVDGFMKASEYEFLCSERDRLAKLAQQWESENPDPSNNKSPFLGFSFRNPYSREMSRSGIDRLDGWIPFNQDSVYYDDAAAVIASQIRDYNRIAVVIQGLFDRSDVLHPHAGAKMWDPNGFGQAINLIYDADAVLSRGEAPDFEAYRERLNSNITDGTIVVGQQDFWLRKCADEYNDKHENSRLIWYQPHGNPGPGRVAKVNCWKPRLQVASFEWMCEKSWAAQRRTPWETHKKVRLQVPGNKLLNVEAYTPGDYKKFLSDRRTRAKYLEWAPLMLAAEEYHAGNLAATLEQTHESHGSTR